jgi:hypothetical protein
MLRGCEAYENDVVSGRLSDSARANAACNDMVLE